MKKISVTVVLSIMASLVINNSNIAFASGDTAKGHDAKPDAHGKLKVVKTSFDTMYPVKIPTFEGRHLEEGNQFYEKGLYSQAYHEYFMAVRLNPSFWQGFRGIGYVYLRQGKPVKAINNYLKAIEIINPTYAAKTVDEGKLALKEDDLYLAIAKFQKVLNIPPEAGKLVDEGVALFKDNKKAGAQKKFEEAAKIDLTYDKKRARGSYADVHFKLGNLAYEKKKYPEAIKEYEWAVELDPTEFGYHYSLGNSYFKLAFKNRKKIDTELLSKSLKSYEKSYQFNPRDTEVMYNLAIAKIEEASLSKVKVEDKYQEISKIVDGDPKDKKKGGEGEAKKAKKEEVKFDLAKKFKNDKDVITLSAEAEKINTKAVKLSAEAIVLLEKAVIYMPTDANAYSYLGDAYAMVGSTPENFIRASQAYQKAINLDSKLSNLYIKMGTSYYLASKIQPRTEELPITKENSKLYNKFGKKFYKAEMLTSARDSFNSFFAFGVGGGSKGTIARTYLETVENDINNLGFRIPDKSTGR